jgi:hypothetical protein
LLKGGEGVCACGVLRRRASRCGIPAGRAKGQDESGGGSYFVKLPRMSGIRTFPL